MDALSKLMNWELGARRPSVYPPGSNFALPVACIKRPEPPSIGPQPQGRRSPPLAIENGLQPVRRDRQFGDGARHADRLFDRIGDGGADRRDAAFAGALDAERIE